MAGIYVLSKCDAWKSRTSMRPYWIGDNTKMLFNVIRGGIADGTFEFGNKSREQDLADFDKLVSNNSIAGGIHHIQNNLMFGYLAEHNLNSYT